MPDVTCQNPACAKRFTFDKATTNSSFVALHSEGVKPAPGEPETRTVSYFPTCPHCGKRQTFTTRERI